MYCCFTICFIGFIPGISSQSATIISTKDSPQATYAAAMIERSLVKKGYFITEAKADYVITLAVNAGTLTSEAYSIVPERKRLRLPGAIQGD